MIKPTLIALLLATVGAGCGSSGGVAPNKAGAPAATTRQVLHLEATDAGSPEARHFAKRIEARSGGSLRVEVGETYGSIVPANEARLARDLRAGRADFGVLPARAWPAAGVGAFAALQAPFVLGSYDVARAALAGPAGRSLGQALARAGTIPLALVPAELRRLLAVKPLATHEAFRGLRLRVVDNATSSDLMRALGADPVTGITGDQVYAQLRAHRIDGTETAPLFAVDNGYGRFAKHVTGYALFDRVDTLVASPAAWKGLSPSQRIAVRGAAQDTVGFSASLPDRDANDLAHLCARGVHVTTPTPTQLRAIAGATEPVRASLRRDPAAGPILKQLEATPGTGPQLLPPPRRCNHASRPDRAGHASGPTTIPNGVYTIRTTVADFRRVGQFGPDWETSMTWTTRMHDGRWSQNRAPLGMDPKYLDGWWGTYTVRGDRLTFRYLNPEDAGTVETVRWSYYDGRLTFKLVDVADLSARAIYAAHPWRKVR